MNVLLNITYQGQSGNYLVNMEPGVDDSTIKRICEEAVRSGAVPGISPAIPNNAFANFVIDRFHGNQPRFVIRPKVPFGCRNLLYENHFLWRRRAWFARAFSRPRPRS